MNHTKLSHPLLLPSLKLARGYVKMGPGSPEVIVVDKKVLNLCKGPRSVIRSIGFDLNAESSELQTSALLGSSHI